MQAFASSVTIDDQARVLDASKVQAEAAKLSYATLIYTTNTFSGDQDALNQATRSRLPDQNSIVIGIDVAQRHLSIQSGTSVKVSDSQASDAVDAFRSSFHSGDYTGAIIAAIDSLKSGGSNLGTTIFVIVAVIVIGFVILIFVAVRTTRGNNWRGPRGGGGRFGGIYYGGAGGSFGGGGTGGGAGGSF